MTRSIDVHAHVLTEETIGLLRRELPAIGLRLSPIDDESAVLEVAGTPYRPFPRGGWDLERRFRDMDAANFTMQVLSVTPQTFLYGQAPALAVASARIQNEQIAKLVTRHPDRFLGLATLPMQAPEKAAEELTFAMRKLGLRGALIGSNVEGRNLDDPALEPIWAAAAELGAFILVHPVKVAGADRMRAYYLVNLIGNPLDTSIAAACLVFGGVLDRHPNLKICLSHGGGFIPYQAGRLAHGWSVRQEPKAKLPASPEASLRRFYYDCILHSPVALRYLVDSVGAGHVLLGSDYPFDMGMYDAVAQIQSLGISEADRLTILAGQARTLLNISAHEAVR